MFGGWKGKIELNSSGRVNEKCCDSGGAFSVYSLSSAPPSIILPFANSPKTIKYPSDTGKPLTALLILIVAVLIWLAMTRIRRGDVPIAN